MSQEVPVRPPLRENEVVREPSEVTFPTIAEESREDVRERDLRTPFEPVVIAMPGVRMRLAGVFKGPISSLLNLC